MNERFEQWYPTNVMTGSFLDYARLTELTNELLVAEPLLTSPNIIIDDRNLFDSDLVELAQFKQQVVVPAFDQYLKNAHDMNLSDFVQFKFKSWISSNDLCSHNHAGSHFSAVFYLQSESSQGGALQIHDPRFNANRGYPSYKKLTSHFARKDFCANTGDFIIFPSFLYHAVGPFVGNLRIAMPVDLFLSK